MFSDLHVALCPLEIRWGEKETNIQSMMEYLKILHPDTDLLILPECFSTGFPVGMEKDDVRPMAERNTGPTIDILRDASKKYNIAIAGTFIADTGGSLYNRAFFIEPSGEENFADKAHLFTMAGEDKVFSRGYDRLKIRYRGWNMIMVVCYDIRFPVWCRNRNNEYDALIAVANWPTTRVEAWKKLLVARAIENEAYVCGVDCRGVDNKGYEYDGASAVFDFKGKKVDVEGNGGILYATLKKDRLDSFRQKFPAWQDADDFRLIFE